MGGQAYAITHLIYESVSRDFLAITHIFPVVYLLCLASRNQCRTVSFYVCTTLQANEHYLHRKNIRLLTLITIALVALLAIPSIAADVPMKQEQKTHYAVGPAVARQISVFNLTTAEFDVMKEVLTAGATGKTPLVA